jgi:hypothetical protein
LLDQQRSELPAFPENPDIEERSFLFLLQPPGVTTSGVVHTNSNVAPSDASVLRVTLRSILTGLTAHHILLQLMGTILLQGTKHVTPRYILFLSRTCPGLN